MQGRGTYAAGFQWGQGRRQDGLGVRSRQSDHVNASMNCKAYAAVQSGFLKAVLGGIASVRWGGVSCAMVRGGALQCGALLGLLRADGDGNGAR